MQAIDHIVGNIRTNEMNLWANYINTTLNFETFIEFAPGDISTQYSALLSKVVRSKEALEKNKWRCRSNIIRSTKIELLA